MASPSGVYAFVMLKDGVTDSELEVTKALQQLVRTHIGGFAVPEAFLVRVASLVPRLHPPAFNRKAGGWSLGTRLRVTGNVHVTGTCNVHVAVSNHAVAVATVITTLILYTVKRRTPLK